MRIVARTAALSTSVCVLIAAAAGVARAQPATAGEEDAPVLRWSLGGGAIGLMTHADPAFDGRTFTEGYLTQPVFMGRLSAARAAGLELTASINLEGLTLRRGELNAGIFGEGYVDRRHPHTLIHELMATVSGSLAVASFRSAATTRWRVRSSSSR